MGGVTRACWQMLRSPCMNGGVKVKSCSLATPGKTSIALNAAHEVILSHSLIMTWLYEKINKTMGCDWAH